MYSLMKEQFECWRYHYHYYLRPETIPPTGKQRLNVNNWGGISSKGATPFAVSLKNKLISWLMITKIIFRHLNAI